MNSSIIELRELDNQNPQQINGNFEVDLKQKNIIVKDGDEINIKSLFLDTTAQNSGEILIDDTNKDIIIKNYLYMSNFRSELNGGRNLNHKNGIPAIDQVQPDGKLYVLCNRHASPLPATGGYVGLLKINSLACNFTGAIGQQCDPFFIRYKYLNDLQQETFANVKFPGIDDTTTGPTDKPIYGTFAGDIIFFSRGNTEAFQRADLFETVVEPPNILFPTAAQRDTKGNRGKSKFNVSPINYQVEPVSIGDKFSPATFTTKFSLTKGKYSPDNLAKAITDKMSNIIVYSNDAPAEQRLTNDFIPTPVPAKYNAGSGTGLINFPSRSNFCSSSKQLCYDSFYGFSTPDNLYLVCSDGNSILDFEALATQNNYLIGSSEMSLEFIQETNKFQFTQLHTSQFTDGGNPIIRYFNSSNNEKSFLSIAVGGVFFQDLEPINLWFDTLGFSSTDLLVLPEAQVLGDYGGSAIQQALVPSFKSLEIGKNITADFSGVDVSLIKENFQDNADKTLQLGVDIIRESGEIGIIQTDGTTVLNLNSIRAQTSFNISTQTEGYYLIQIEGLPRQDLTNLPNDHIQAIVSKYYSSGSFTIMEGSAGSFNYKHIGNPFYIQNLRVKVLEADGSDPQQLGTNNTVFLEIFRQNPNMDF